LIAPALAHERATGERAILASFAHVLSSLSFLSIQPAQAVEPDTLIISSMLAGPVELLLTDAGGHM
jgi:hypothetical protein